MGFSAFLVTILCRLRRAGAERLCVHVCARTHPWGNPARIHVHSALRHAAVRGGVRAAGVERVRS